MNGAPANASSGTESGSSATRILTVCSTYGVSVSGSNGRRRSRSAGDAQRRLAHRSGAGGDVDAEPDRMGRHDDVAEQHRGVDAVPTHRLQGQLGGEVGLLDRVENAAVTSPLPGIRAGCDRPGA